MTTHLPTLKQLQYLVALANHGHFGRAADACFVTQSTLSAGLKELESLMGVTLVERTRRVVRFTPLGERVAVKARRILRDAEDMADMVRASGKPLAGELRMGVIPTIAPFLLPAMLPRLRAKWPDLKLYLREETSQVACDSLQRGQLDCVLLALPFACGEVDGRIVRGPLPRRLPAGTAPPPGTVRRRRSIRRLCCCSRTPLPEGPCAHACTGRSCAPKRRSGHLAAHPRADGRQWPRHHPGPGMAWRRAYWRAPACRPPARRRASLPRSPWSGAKEARARRIQVAGGGVKDAPDKESSRRKPGPMNRSAKQVARQQQRLCNRGVHGPRLSPG